jgi:hypothetical protein
MSKYIKLQLNDDELFDAVEQVIVDFVQRRKSFTAYDITTILRDEVGSGINICHDTIKEIVFEKMAYLLSDVPLYTSRLAPEINSNNPPNLFEPAELVTQDEYVQQPVVGQNNVVRNTFVTLNPYKVNSDVIREIGWSGDVANTGNLDVTLQNDSKYCYYDVPFTAYAAFINAPSKGRFYNSGIKGIYKSEKLM